MKNHFKFKHISYLLLLFLVSFSSCDKQEGIIENKTDQELIRPNNPDQTGIVTRSGENACLRPYFELFSNHFRNYRSTDPGIYFSDEVFGEFKTQLNVERTKMESIGFLQYMDQLQEAGKISPETKKLMNHIHESVNTESEVVIADLELDLVTLYDPKVTGVDDPFYWYIYNIALEIYNNYYAGPNDGVTFRSDCPFKDFVAHVIETAGIGAGIGGFLGSILIGKDENGERNIFILQGLGLVVKVTGAVLGGAIGAIVGIFTHNDDGCQDCHPVSLIVTTSDDDCDLTRTLQALGAGPDAIAFEWVITQGGTSVTITTTTEFLTVTQAVSTAPIAITAASWCIPEGESDPTLAALTVPTETVTIDLSTAASSLLGQIGGLTLTNSCANYVEDPFEDPPSPYSHCFHVDVPTDFWWHAGNVGSGHIVYDFTLDPLNLGSWDPNSPFDNSVYIHWNGAGDGTFEVTATNTCSGVSETETINFTVYN